MLFHCQMTYSPTGVKSAETGERFPPLTHSASKLALLVWLHLGPWYVPTIVSFCYRVKTCWEKKVTWIRFRSPWATDTISSIFFIFGRCSIEICEMRYLGFGNMAPRRSMEVKKSYYWHLLEVKRPNYALLLEVKEPTFRSSWG